MIFFRNTLLGFGVLACLFSLQAQTTVPASQGPPPRSVLQRKAYVRRISAGAILSIPIQNFVPNNTTNSFVENPRFDAQYTTIDASQRIGYGVTVNVSLSERIAVNGSLIYRRAGYIQDSDVFTGVDNANTTVDERTRNVGHEDTRARFYDLPVVVRYYGKNRHDPGTRPFLELGGALRRVSNIRTSVSTSVNNAAAVCCSSTPAASQRTIRGAVIGVGFQAIDPIGIRVIPYARYTRWFGETFSNQSAVSRRNQIEGGIAFTF